MEFRLAEQRVNKINEPLLVIGLGGTGSDALLHVKDQFRRHFTLPVINGQELDAPARTAYLAVDTDATVPAQKKCGDTVLQPQEFFDLSRTDLADLLDPAHSGALLTSYERDWLDPNLRAPNAAHGAEAVRQCGRFMLCRKADQLEIVLETLIRRLLTVSVSQCVGESVTVVILAGVAGGTGSSTFLDMAYLIRHVMEQRFLGIRLTLLGYFFMPDVTMSNFSQAAAVRTRLYANGFAALKELDFWMNVDQHRYAYTHQYSQNLSVKWDQPPFHDVVLISGANEDGSVISHAYQATMDTVAETLMLLFTIDKNHPTDGFSYRDHLENVQAQTASMERLFPVYYGYTAIGTASLEGPKNDMLLHETTHIFDRLALLQGTPSLIGTRFPDDFHRAVFPESENPYHEFSAVVPLPTVFNMEREWNPFDPGQLNEEKLLHRGLYIAFVRSASQDAILYAKEYRERAWARFRDRTEAAIGDPLQGPFRMEEYLRDPERGFLDRLVQWKQYYQSEAENYAVKAAMLRDRIERVLYPAMMAGGVLARFSSQRHNGEYLSATGELYSLSRNQVLAEQLQGTFAELHEQANRYAKESLTEVNWLVRNTCVSLHEEEQNRLKDGMWKRETLILYDDVCQYVDKGFTQLERDEENIANWVLAKLARRSFAAPDDGAPPFLTQMEAKQQELFLETVDMVNDLSPIFREYTMEDAWKITMQENSEEDRVTYITINLLPELHSRARVLHHPCPAMRNLPNGQMVQSYVSVPDDAVTFQKGLQRYHDFVEPIIVKETEIKDRLIWLKTCNHLPLCSFAELSSMEAGYEACFHDPSHDGLHLVDCANRDSHGEGIRNTWKAMPSPMPHLLLGAPLSDRQKAKLQHLRAMMDRAFSLGAVKLSDEMPDGVVVHLLRDGNGLPAEGEALRDRMERIIDDAQTTGGQKHEALLKLTQDRTPIRLIYGDFTDAFAKALSLRLCAEDGGESARLQAEGNRVKVREYIAGYMISLRPELQEQLEGQLPMLEELQKALTKWTESTESNE